MKFKRYAVALFMAALCGSPAFAKNGEETFEGAAEVRLEPIELTESKNTVNRITQADIERKTAVTLWDALKGVPGVFQQSTGGRNEGTVSIRGSNRYQIGMYIDDIPIATAYRNEWDFNNTLLYDLDSIEVSKGYSSPLLASNNNLGGAINLRTAKPVKELEASARYINFFDRDVDDQGRMVAASVGTKQDLFYLKASAAYSAQDFFTLPEGFDAARQEDGGRRVNSDYQDKGINLIAGWTPTEKVDVMFGFVRQSFEKGQPFDAAQTYANPPYPNAYPFQRYWYWPEYETTRYYVNANMELTGKARLKAVAYYDQHNDTSVDYYTMDMSRRGYPDKTYDQYTSGGQLTYGYSFNDANNLDVSAGYRRLSHKEYNDYANFDDSGLPGNRKKKAADTGRPMDEHMVEDYWDFGAEYTLKPVDRLTFVLGASYSYMTPQTLESRDHVTGVMSSFKDGLDDSKSLFNYQAGVFYDLAEKHELYATFARKSRFATMRERYFRAGGVPANPDLDPEKAYHYEIGYRGLVDDWLKINSGIYYSDVDDMIVSQGPRGATYFTNLNKADFYGLDLGAEAVFNEYVSAGASFSYLEWNNRTNDDNLTGLPRFSCTVYGVISPLKGLSIIPQINMSSGFYWNNNPKDAYSEAPGYATADLKAVYDVNDHFSLEAGVRNIFDKEYAFSAYYPEQGRNYFMGVSIRW